MVVRETIQFDLELIDRLIADEEATLEPKHRASIEPPIEGGEHVAGGVASSWQSSPPHTIYVDRGEGSHVWDIDGNGYVDYHLGYGAMAIGHAHPKVVEAIEQRARLGTHFAQPTTQLHEVGENLSERFGLRSGASELRHGVDARGRSADARCHRPRRDRRSRAPTTAITTR